MTKSGVKTMKHRFLYALVGGLILATNASAQWEMRVAYQGDYPKHEMWRGRADGAEMQLVHWWQPSGVGVAFTGGYTRWNVRDFVVDQGTFRTDTLSGRADYTPFGLSALLQAELADHPGFITTLEAGVRYMQCKGDMQLTRRMGLGGGSPNYQTFKLDCDDGVVGRISAGIEVMVSEGDYPTTLFASVGYQFDLSKGSAVNHGWPRYETELSLESTFFQLGIAIPLQ